MIIAIINESGRLDVFNSATGKIVSGAIAAGLENQPALPDRRLDIILGLLEDLMERVEKMSQVQDTVAAEVATLKSNMVDLHAGISGIQSRLDAALAAAAASTDPTVLADLHGVNTDLQSVITALAPSVTGATGVTDQTGGAPSVAGAAASAEGPASAAQPAVEQAPAAPAAADPVVFDASNSAPNAPGGRNSSQLANFDPAVAETP